VRHGKVWKNDNEETETTRYMLSSRKNDGGRSMLNDSAAGRRQSLAREARCAALPRDLD
jgi:hypothetical protein